MTTDPILTFKYAERMIHRPFLVQGRSGAKHGHAHYDEKHAGHTFQMPLSKYLKVAYDLVRGFDRPFCKFFLVAVEVPEMTAEIERLTLELALAQTKLEVVPAEKPREEWTFKDAYAYAKQIGLPRYSVIGKSGDKVPLIAAIAEYEKALSQDQAGDQAPPPSAEVAA